MPQPASTSTSRHSATVVRLRGLIGALGLHDPVDQVVLPHEDVMPWPVEDRASLQEALEAHIEPIWLVYDGGGAASAVVDAAVDGTPCVDTATADGVRHRLWVVTDASELAAVRDDLAGRQALIADGHHRYAAYRRVQAARHQAGAGAGPWDFGLALLVDLHTHAPEVGAIHRAVRGVRLSEVAPAGDARGGWLGVRAPPATPGSMLVVDGEGTTVQVALAVAKPVGRVRRHRRRDAARSLAGPRHGPPARGAAAHLGRAGGRGGLSPRCGGRRASAAREGGVAVLLAPVDVADVLALAAEGVRMPRKSTSFGPKPRSGFVVRTFAAG